MRCACTCSQAHMHTCTQGRVGPAGQAGAWRGLRRTHHERRASEAHGRRLHAQRAERRPASLQPRTPTRDAPDRGARAGGAAGGSIARRRRGSDRMIAIAIGAAP